MPRSRASASRHHAPFLASVVSAELRAGAVDQTGRSVVLELTDRFDRLGRVVTPEARSWSLAGDVLGDIRRGEPGRRDRIVSLWNDALIALSARQIGASVVTANVGDFELLRRFVRFELEPFERWVESLAPSGRPLSLPPGLACLLVD